MATLRCGCRLMMTVYATLMDSPSSSTYARDAKHHDKIWIAQDVALLKFDMGEGTKVTHRMTSIATTMKTHRDK